MTNACVLLNADGDREDPCFGPVARELREKSIHEN
jgi:ribosomal protein L14